MRKGIIIFLLIYAVLAIIGLTRKNFNYGIETDFLWRFQPEALRLMRGHPLNLDFHPPFYPVILAISYTIFGNWLFAGVFISLLFSLIAILASYQFLKNIFGETEALGGVLGLLLSPVFILYSIQASSDIFYHGLFFCVLFFISLAVKKMATLYWVISGTLMALTLMTRANGIVMIFFFLFPIMQNWPIKFKAKYLVLMLVGFLIPIAMWLAYAKASRSPVYVQYNQVNLAMSYFIDESKSGSVDGTLESMEKFSGMNLIEVVSYNPKKMIYMYSTRLIRNIINMCTNDRLLAFPLILFVLPGVALLLCRRLDRFVISLLIILVLSFLQLSLGSWMSRILIVFVPIMGAGAISFIYQIASLYGSKINRRAVAIIFLMLLSLFYLGRLIALYKTTFIDYSSHDSLAAAEVIKEIEDDRERAVISRKPHLSFYSQSKDILFPNSKTIDELRASIKKACLNVPSGESIYLFYGRSERYYRAQFPMLADQNFRIDWLEKIGEGTEGGGWKLYKVLLSGL